MSAKGLHANVRSAAAISIEVTENRERLIERQPRATFPLVIANIALDARSPLPIHEQICQAVRTAIWSRELPPGTLLPTTRELAQHLGVARNTVVFAYARLTAEGLCVSNTRRGTRVAADLPARSAYNDAGHAAAPPEAVSTRLRTAFQLRDALETRIERTTGGAPFALYSSDPMQYPRTKLGRRLADKFLGAPPQSHIGAVNSCDRFQIAVAAYLRQARGVLCAPQQIIAVSGLECALDLTARVVLDPGDTVQIEDPAMDIVQSAFRAARCYLRRISSDAFGANPKSVDGPPARLIFVSPSVSFPYGVTMSEERRGEILEAARVQNAIVFENDTHFELRYSGANLRSLQGQDKDGRVIYFGGFAETLGNSVRVGYLVVPESLLDAFVEVGHRVANAPAPQVLEALADFVEEHEFAIHARNLRADYAKRLEHTKRACKLQLPQLEMSEPQGGLHLVLYLDRQFDIAAICKAATADGIPVRPLSQFYLDKKTNDGLVLGFGAMPERSVDQMTARLAQLCTEFRRLRS